MVRISRLSTLAAAGIAATGMAVAGMSLAQGNDPAAAAVEARKAHMGLYAANLGILGGMAQGRTDYDAEAAQAAADNLVTLASIDQRFYWVPGTHVGAVEDTRALEAIWTDGGGIQQKQADFVEATSQMQEAAGGGLDSLRGAIRPLGGSCGGCHEDYRQSDD